MANQLTDTVGLDVPLEKLWRFFSTAQNLAPLTPPDQKLRVGKGGDTPIAPGLEIEISVAPILGIRTGWLTRIVEVHGPEQGLGQAWFKDIQEAGPFAQWDHIHAFRALPGGGTAVMDRVEYRLPAGKLGQAVAGFWVRRQVEGLFTYRRAALHKMFGEAQLPEEWAGGWTLPRHSAPPAS
jgi:ligand-binding SRPBCC domain-containing protein